MTVKGINVKSLLFAGFVSGYLMYFIDKYFGGFLGLFGMFPGTDNLWWMIEHHIDSIIFALAFAWPYVYRRLPGDGWFKGLGFGLIWTIALTITSVVAGALGSDVFKQMAKLSVSSAVNMLILHLVWGFFLGILYQPADALKQDIKPTVNR